MDPAWGLADSANQYLFTSYISLYYTLHVYFHWPKKAYMANILAIDMESNNSFTSGTGVQGFLLYDLLPIRLLGILSPGSGS